MRNASAEPKKKIGLPKFLVFSYTVGESKIAMLIMIVIAVVAVYISYTQLSRIEVLKASEVQNEMIDCIEDHNNSTDICLQVCKGTYDDSGYPFIEELDNCDCGSYISELTDRLNL